VEFAAELQASVERWLESMVREDVTRVDAPLDPRFVYAQVFASAGSEHGIPDLLTVTRPPTIGYAFGVICIAEIAGYGYFPGVELQQVAPLVYLVAPALRFHPPTDELLKYLSAELEIVCVGLRESWRRGLQIVMRQ